jgi:type VI secretion system protein
MPQERLLERIRRFEADPDRRGTTDPNEVVQSILAHLRKILNARQGSALIADDYGVPDFTDLAATFSSDKVRDLVRSVKTVINKYEPRLSSVKVESETQMEHYLELHFKIDGALIMGDQVEVPVSFETIIDPSGKIKVTA